MAKRKTPKETLLNIYKELYNEFGPQGWWPVTRKNSLIPEYFKGKRSESQKFEIMVGAILTQNTQWKPNVEKAIEQLNRNGLMDIDRILAVSHDELCRCIRSAGYYNQKAERLRTLAQFLKKISIRQLEKCETQKARMLLLNLKGIGPETADSILLYALGKPVFVVDSYTRRLLQSKGLIDGSENYDDIQRLFMNNLSLDAEMFNEYHALIVQHGKMMAGKRSSHFSALGSEKKQRFK